MSVPLHPVFTMGGVPRGWGTLHVIVVVQGMWGNTVMSWKQRAYPTPATTWKTRLGSYCSLTFAGDY